MLAKLESEARVPIFPVRSACWIIRVLNELRAASSSTSPMRLPESILREVTAPSVQPTAVQPVNITVKPGEVMLVPAFPPNVSVCASASNSE